MTMMDSTISTVGAKLDLQRQAREDSMNKRAIEVAKKKDRMHQYRRLKAASVQFGIECK